MHPCFAKGHVYLLQFITDKYCNTNTIMDYSGGVKGVSLSDLCIGNLYMKKSESEPINNNIQRFKTPYRLVSHRKETHQSVRQVKRSKKNSNELTEESSYQFEHTLLKSLKFNGKNVSIKEDKIQNSKKKYSKRMLTSNDFSDKKTKKEQKFENDISQVTDGNSIVVTLEEGRELFLFNHCNY